jgi:hypothetical protein
VEGVLKCNPQRQKPNPRHHAAYRPVGRKDRKHGEVQKQRVPIPKRSGPRRIENRQANVHFNQHAQKQLGALQPARNPLWLMARCMLWRRCGLRRGAEFQHGGRFGPRRGSLVRGNVRRLHFRLLGHSVYSPDAPDFSPIAGILHKPINRPGSGTPYLNGITTGGGSRTAHAKRIGSPRLIVRRLV